MVKTITRYQASDGAIFESEMAAIEYERTLSLKALIASYETDQKPWTTDAILLVLIRHAGDFIDLLTEHLDKSPSSLPSIMCRDALRRSWEEWANVPNAINLDMVIMWLTRNSAAIIKILVT